MPLVFLLVGRNENRGYIHSSVNHVLDEFEAGHPGHADIEEEAGPDQDRGIAPSAAPL